MLKAVNITIWSNIYVESTLIDTKLALPICLQL